MLSSVFRHRGLDLATSQNLSDLIESFDTSKEHRPFSVPCNLYVALRWLSVPPFEPLHTSMRLNEEDSLLGCSGDSQKN